MLWVCILGALAIGNQFDGHGPGESATASSSATPDAPGKPTAQAKPTKQPREFAPGVRIDWQQRHIEVDTEIVLREGPLELLACSPQTREHESILSVQARPFHIFQAMGLIGLQPGSPMRYDEKHDRRLPPTGEALTLRVRYREGDTQRVVPVERWLLDVERRRPPEKINWVFAGSRTFQEGQFGADVEGTVVCVVDFETALITVGALHSADNELLWLTANTDAIPPVGTACTLLIHSAAAKTVEVEVADDGTLRRGGKAVPVADLVRALQREPGDNTRLTLVLRTTAKVPAKTIQSAIDSLTRAGVDRAFIEVRRLPPRPDPDKTPVPKVDG